MRHFAKYIYFLLNTFDKMYKVFYFAKAEIFSSLYILSLLEITYTLL